MSTAARKNDPEISRRRGQRHRGDKGLPKAPNPLSPLGMIVLAHLIRLATLALLAGSLGAADFPNPLAAADGNPVTTAKAWREQVRPWTMQQFRGQIYGVRPVDQPADYEAKVLRIDSKLFEGAATSKEVEITFSGPGGRGKIRPLVITPNSATKPVGAFLLIGFRAPDPNTPANSKGEWPVREIIARGYAAVAFDFNDADPDRLDGFKESVRAIYGKEPLAEDAWGALSAWGWGASRVMDYLVTDRDVDAKRIAIVGHSRAGKAALWCGAEDERFSLVISNNSGCSGASLARTKQGERITNISTRFPYWFCSNYQKYANNESSLPVDQHQLIGLIAPRLVYVASATEDPWADPKSEFESCVLAGPVFKLLGKKGLESTTMPPPDHAMLAGSIGYHLRTGKHNLERSDWQHFIDFADLHWGKERHLDERPPSD